MQERDQGHGRVRRVRRRQLPGGREGQARAEGGAGDVREGDIQGRTVGVEHGEEGRPEEHQGRSDHVDRREGEVLQEYRVSDQSGGRADHQVEQDAEQREAGQLQY